MLAVITALSGTERLASLGHVALGLVFGLLSLAAWAGPDGTGEEMAAPVPIRLGILAHREPSAVQAAWKPLVESLNRVLPPMHYIELVPGNFEQINRLASEGGIDLLLTNPAHHVRLRAERPQMRALATIVESRDGILLSGYGGVIIAAAGRNQPATLADLQTARIAAVSPDSLGGYQAQLYEMHRAGLALPRPGNVHFTDMPQSLVIDEVLSGRADAGFLRTSVLEMLEAEGRLDLSQLRIITPQDHLGFHYVSSTALYPQWVLTAMPEVGIELANAFAITLLSMPDTAPTARPDTRVSFAVAVDYQPVEAIARTLRLPPFDVTPDFHWTDVPSRYPFQTLAFSLLLMALLISLIAVILFNRRLDQARLKAARVAADFDRLVAELPVGIYELNERSLEHPMELGFVSHLTLRMFGLDPSQPPEDYASLVRNIHPDDRALVEAKSLEARRLQRPFHGEFRVCHDDVECWLEAESWPMAARSGLDP
jgi:ABC-type phosphate/phosphonate transport system substrate-binding protein